jgi:uncharacterized protein with GYD domain
VTIYITQGNYTREAIAGMVDKPEDRVGPVSKLVAAAGGKLLDYYVTFGKYDFLCVIESKKKDTEMVAALFAAAASGGVMNLNTTVGMRFAEAQKGIKGAKKILKGFDPAG